ncbi:hypothetical protein FH972_024618 [Carpinus fangiana]|uniref:DUF7730 domain-containing protein n=1 Tax=Carpinus fangiana TaxID=176857 RepID=A0A5N6KYI4_9ROSI|nr:hypothetical protein FH972_024618 [Carpinus fangiana]
MCRSTRRTCKFESFAASGQRPGSSGLIASWPPPPPPAGGEHCGVAQDVDHLTNPQTACAFLTRVPFEIRTIIIDLVLGNHILHIGNETLFPKALRRKGKTRPVAHLQCPMAASEEECPHRFLAASEQYSSHSHVKTDMLSLLQTCRLLYREAAARLYASNIFDFGASVFARMTICLFAQALPPQRLSLIRSLQFSYQCLHKPERARGLVLIVRDPQWSELWSLFASDFTGLQRMKVDLLGGGGHTISPGFEKAILGPLCQLEEVRDFRVSISWQRPEEASELPQDLPFTIVQGSTVEDRVFEVSTSEPLIFV